MTTAKRNCVNCRFLKWETGDVNDPEGWVCTGYGDYRSPKAESDHLARLESKDYREKAKVCHEPPSNMECASSGCS